MGLFSKDKPKKQKRIKNYSGDSSVFHDELILQMERNARETNAMKLSSVYCAISTISDTMSKIPFNVINRFTKEKIDDPELYYILNMQPNEKMNAGTMNKLFWTWVLTEGEGYCVPVRKYRTTRVEQLIPVPPSSVSKTIDADNKLWYTVTLSEKNNLTLRYDEIIHLKAMTVDGINGISPLEYAKNTVQSGLNQESYNEAFYKNFARPADYLKTVADLSSKKVKKEILDENGQVKTIDISLKDRLREDWERAHTGDNRFKTAILDNGLEYVTVPQITPEQMQFVNSKEVNVEDIARFFNMASCSFKLGIGKQSYSTNEQGQICYITETIVPKLRQWEQELTLKLLTEEQRNKGWVIKGNLNAELRGDSTTRANFYDKMRSMGVYNINEIRALEDMPSIGEKGETRLIGANSVPLERLLNGESAGTATPNDLTDNKESTEQKEEEEK